MQEVHARLKNYLEESTGNKSTGEVAHKLLKKHGFKKDMSSGVILHRMSGSKESKAKAHEKFKKSLEKNGFKKSIDPDLEEYVHKKGKEIITHPKNGVVHILGY